MVEHCNILNSKHKSQGSCSLVRIRGVVVSAAIGYRPALDYVASEKNMGSHGLLHFWIKWAHIGCNETDLLTGVGRERQGDILRQVANLVAEGKLKPLIHEQRFSGDEVNEAQALYETREHTV